MTETLLSIRDLSRRYGRVTALDGLSLEIPKGVVAAFVGANGAGKTTTFSILGGFIRPHRGEIEVGSLSLVEYRRRGGLIGILPQDVQFFEDRSVSRQLTLFSKLAGSSARAAAHEVDWVLEQVGLQDKRNALPAELSHGMRVRLGVAQALIGKPPLILLDEPTAGLDPKMVAGFRELIANIRGETTLVISSHHLSELENLCNYVCIVDRGRLLKQGPMQSLLSHNSHVSYVVDKFYGDIAMLEQIAPFARFKLRDSRVIVARFDAEKHTIQELNAIVLRWLLERGVSIISVEGQRSLEEMFLSETGG